MVWVGGVEPIRDRRGMEESLATVNPPSRPNDPRSGSDDHASAAALWLGGAGAALLLTAAAVLVALRWHDLSAWMKLAGLIAVNGGAIGIGAAWRDRLPATGRALFELGICLIPISASATCIQAGLDWRWTTAVTGLAGFVGAMAGNRVRRSSTLELVAMVSVVAVTGGVSALTAAPASLLLASAAFLVLASGSLRTSRWEIAAGAWAGLGGALPLLSRWSDARAGTSGALLRWIDTGNLVDVLGLGGEVPPASLLVGAAGCATALVVLAHRRVNEVPALVAIATGVVALLAAGGDAQSPRIDPLAQAVTIGLILQLVGVASRRHQLWRQIYRWFGPTLDAGFAIATLLVAGAALEHTLDDGNASTATAVAAALCAVGWFVADQRWRAPDCQRWPMALVLGGGFGPSTMAIAVATASAATLAGLEAVHVGWVTLGTAGLLTLAGRTWAHATLVCGAFVAIAITPAGWSSLWIAAASALTLAAAVATRRGTTPAALAGSTVMTAAAISAAGIVAANTVSIGAQHVVAWMLFAIGVGLVTTIAERASRDPLSSPAGLIGRAALVVVALPSLAGTVQPTLAGLFGVALCWVILDVARTKDLRLLAPLAGIGPAALLVVLDHAALMATNLGVGLAVAVAASAGIAVVTMPSMRPVLAGLAPATLGALAHAAPSPGATSSALLILGTMGIVLAVDQRSFAAGTLGASAATIGLWIRLFLEGATAAEFYVAPVAAALVAYGLLTVVGRAMPTWWTHGLAAAMIGGTALVERVAGGHGGHALVAGGVATIATLVGARFHMVGPLVVGTVLLGVVAAHESLGYAASVPTWGWLAIAGTTLLGAGVAVERRAVSPIESGRSAVNALINSYR